MCSQGARSDGVGHGALWPGMINAQAEARKRLTRLGSKLQLLLTRFWFLRTSNLSQGLLFLPAWHHRAAGPRLRTLHRQQCFSHCVQRMQSCLSLRNIEARCRRVQLVACRAQLATRVCGVPFLHLSYAALDSRIWCRLSTHTEGFHIQIFIRYSRLTASVTSWTKLLYLLQ